MPDIPLKDHNITNSDADDGSTTVRFGTINPLKRTKFAVKRMSKVNPKTTALVILFNLLVLFASIALVASAVIVSAGRFITSFVQTGGTSIGSADPATVIGTILVILTATAAAWLIGLYSLGLLGMTTLASVRGEKIGFRTAASAVFSKLPRLILVALVISLISTVMLLSYLTVVAILTAIGNAAPIFIVGTLASLGFIAASALICMRFFIYAYLIVVDSNVKPIRAFYINQTYFQRAPGYTFSLLLIAINAALVLDIIGSLLTQLTGFAFIEAIMTILAGLLIMSIVVVGYIDIKAANRQPIQLKASRGSITLGIIAAILLFIGAIAATPRNPVTSPLVQGTGFPGNSEYIE